MPRDARPLGPPAVALAAALAAMWPAPASAWAARPERIDLHWTAPAECPAADAVRAEMDRILGASSARPPAPIPVVAAVSRDPEGTWQVHLETPGDGAPRVREIHGATCAAIAETTALILAMMIDPAAAAAAPPSEAPRVPVEPPRLPIEAPRLPVEPPRLPVTPPEPPTPTPTPTSFRLTALTGLDTASLPDLAFTLGLHGSFVYGPQRFELGLAFRPSRKGNSTMQTSAGADVDLLTGSAATCTQFSKGILEAGPCVGFELGRLHASGFGVSSPGEGSTLWAAIEGGGVLSVRIFSQLSLVLRLGAAVPLLRPSFVLVNVGPVFRPPAVTARGSTGVEVVF